MKILSRASSSYQLDSDIITIPTLLGPTSSGKTSISLALAMSRPIEIISVDSALVYRGMDIGTSKPTKNERDQVKHHLIDIRDPANSYSVMNFISDTLRLIQEIISRGKTPMLVGGTMFYYKALTHGINNLPSSDPKVRSILDSFALLYGWPTLHAWLTKIDPKIASKIRCTDSQRIQRALEVFIITKKPMSDLLTNKKCILPSVQLNEPRNISSEDILRDIEEQVKDIQISHYMVKPLFRYRFLPITLEPSVRSVLHERISVRFDSMLSSGFIEEVENLHLRTDLHIGLPSIRCVGYRQAWEFLEGKIDYKSMREKSISATRQLCKRQLTWLRSISERIVIDCIAPDAYMMVVRAIRQVIDRQV